MVICLKIKVPEQVNVLGVRDKLHMAQREFADQFGFEHKNPGKMGTGNPPV